MPRSMFIVQCGEIAITLPEGLITGVYGFERGTGHLSVFIFWKSNESIGGSFIPVIQKPEETVEMAVKRHFATPFPSGCPELIRTAIVQWANALPA